MHAVHEYRHTMRHDVCNTPSVADLALPEFAGDREQIGTEAAESGENALGSVR